MVRAVFIGAGVAKVETSKHQSWSSVDVLEDGSLKNKKEVESEEGRVSWCRHSGNI